MYGNATPPTSYGGFGGNSQDKPKYSFQYPSNWKKKTVNKTQKGMQGIDTSVQDPKNKLNKAFTVTFNRAGEDGKAFKLTDTDATFSSFAGADYDLQDAVISADGIQTSQREDGQGQKYYDYIVEGDTAVYYVTVTVERGRVFAFFVSSAAAKYKDSKTTMDKMIKSFGTLDDGTV